MAQVFISYSRVDTAFVQHFIIRLQQAFPELVIWHDKSAHGLIGGDNWWNEILRAIENSDVFIYILSNESIQSLYCQAEFTESRRLQKRIITIQARDRTELTDNLEDIQFIDMKNGVDDPESLVRLSAAVQKQLQLAKKQPALWKTKTPKPEKEKTPARDANSPAVTTAPLTIPLAEQVALKIAKEGLQWQKFLGLATLAFTLIAALIGLTPFFAEQFRLSNENATVIALTEIASQSVAETLSVTDVHTATNSPTPSPSPSATNSPDPNEQATLLQHEIENLQATDAFLQTQNENATIQAESIFASVTASYLNALAQGTQQAVETENGFASQTALVITPPSPTSTANLQQTAAALLTETQIFGMTATATQWTVTPTVTPTPNPTFTHTVTATSTRRPTQISTFHATNTPQNVLVSVNTASANLRSGPGTNYRIIDAANRGESFRVIAKYGDWYLVQLSQNQTAWVSSTVVTVEEGNLNHVEIAVTIPPSPVPSVTPQTIRVTYINNYSYALNLYNYGTLITTIAPNTQYVIVVPRGPQNLVICNSQGQYCSSNEIFNLYQDTTYTYNP